LSTHPRLCLPSGLFPSGFPTNILYVFLFYPLSCYMPCPPHVMLRLRILSISVTLQDFKSQLIVKSI
jgi:hypothetical protein